MNTQALFYPFDPTGANSTNLVTGERQTINPPAMQDFYYIVPKAGPYFRNSLKVRLYPSGVELLEGVDYNCTHLFHAATHSIGLGIYGSITFYDHTLTGIVSLEYQTLGGDWTIDEQKINEILVNTLINPRITTWEQAVNVPYQFPPINHEFNIDNFVGADDVVDWLGNIRDAILLSGEGLLADHLSDFDNPHNVTKDQVGLNLVNNLALATSLEATSGTINTAYMTPLRTAQAIQVLAWTRIDNHSARNDNPHGVTKAQVGLSGVENFPLASTSEAEVGASHARYMTPLRTKEAIAFQIVTAFNTFVARRDNPNVVTKTQVGLPLVDNFATATKSEAELGASATTFMTAQRTREAIVFQVGSYLTNHLADFANPHQVSKTQIGLSAVRNLPTATQAEAEAGLSDDFYMTPLMTRYAIQVLADASVGTHAGLINNPHQVTASQVGAYSRTEMDVLLEDKLNVGDAAADTLLVFGKNQGELYSDIEGLTSADSLKVGGFTAQEIMDQVQQGEAANALMLEGQTKEEILTEYTESGVLGSAQSVLPAIVTVRDPADPLVDIVLSESWTRVGTMYPFIEEGGYLSYLEMIVIGGGYESNVDAPKALVTVKFTQNGYNVLQKPEVELAQIQPLNDAARGFELHYRIFTGADTFEYCEFWVKDGSLRNSLTFTELSKRNMKFEDHVQISDSTLMTTVAPSDVVPFTVLTPYANEVLLTEVATSLQTNTALFNTL